jgi:hypothetical protein
MSESIHAILVLAGVCFAAATIGGSFIFGVATVCRWLKWAPIKSTININNYGEPIRHPTVGKSGSQT